MKETTALGGIAPLWMDDPAVIESELSGSELACLTGVYGSGRFFQLLREPDSATPEEQIELLGCLDRETLLRIFVTGLIEHANPLSEETSDCIRAGMEEIDLRSVMLAGMSGDEEAAMIGGLSGMLLVISCLNEEEYAAAANVLDMNPDDYESLQCVVEQMGGPESMAETLGAGDERSLMAFFAASFECGLQMEGMMPGG